MAAPPDLPALCAAGRSALARRWQDSHGKAAPGHDCTVFLSTSSGSERAHVAIGTGPGFDAAWQRAQRDTAAFWHGRPERPIWLRAEFACDIRAQTWSQLLQRLATTKRNYFRDGISFSADFSQAILAEELGANALLYDNKFVECRPNDKNLGNYGKRRFGIPLTWPTDQAATVWTFATRGVFCDGLEVHDIEHAGRHRGYREIAAWDAGQVSTLIHKSAAYLARQVKPSGEYQYGWFPCFDREIPSYNALRHASSTYALLEGWELTRDAAQRDAIERALDWLCTRLIHDVRLPDGQEAAFLVDVGNEIKLGGNAVCILALTLYSQLTGEHRHLPLLQRLAVGILHMQDPDSGRFVHVLNYPDLSLKARERIIYYDGEAAFGLMRLYGLDRDERWLAAVEKAFDHFIAAGHWRAHDHWLSYCVNELTLYRPDARYYRFGLDNVRGHLDFVLERITTYPTLLELMMAAQKMIARLQRDPERAHLLDGFDLGKFRRALDYRARYLLTGFFWPELAMFFARPSCIVDGFFIRHHSFRVRIDDVEHYLSGYAAYWKYLTALKTDAVEASALPERILFLHDDLREVGNGIEVAGVRRATLMQQALGLTPWILTSAFSPRLRQAERSLKQTGGLPEAVSILNIYDWLAEMASDGRLRTLGPGWGIPGHARRSQAGAVLRWTWEVSEGDQRLQREEFHLAGEHGCFLRKQSLFTEGGLELQRIVLQFADGAPREFQRERDFIHAMMAANLDGKVFWHLLIDRNKSYRGVLQNDLRSWISCSITAVIHSNHRLADGQYKGTYWYPLHHPQTCDQLIVLTGRQRDDLVREGVPADRLSVIPHWLPVFPEPAPEPPEASPCAVYFARYSPEKGHLPLLRAFARVVERIPQARLHTFGVGPLKRHLQRWVEQYGLQDNIVIGDFVHDIGAEYRKATIGVLCSSEEGFAMAGMECMAHGRPLVAFDVRYGPADLLGHQPSGMLVPAGDERALAEAIASLLDDPDRARQLGVNARASARRFAAEQAAYHWRQWWSRVHALANDSALEDRQPA